ncbi:CID domain [Macleaya cordata]|uniref:CID domain n=1 Tax=Macleaya cordata TaxID=56857 RepID=A0A200R590_MACCD|nr:CID domain [Macleaya cordata]
MEMKNSRRSIDKSREPILKKPRLAEEDQRDLSSNGVARQFPQRISAAAGPGTGPLIQRFRANEKVEDTERDNSLREAYQQQQQELVREYKNALAELTFNSKPIITNLTIIAGENLHAAKWIAAAICTNIIEVPTEQKLPSLYLLDSIVKNIGRDYIKYFAARLPEVFCKAYRQVDSSIHPSMRHLFGTWKGVFPSSSLQIIEKELDFLPAINGSSSGVTATRPDSQSQRPPHSIHVNPKYLEARQRLQPSSRAKMTTSDNTGTMVTATEDAERPDKTTIIGNGRPWTDLSMKMNNIPRPQRETLSEHVNEKSTGAGYDDQGYVSDSPGRLDLGSGSGETERGLDSPWYGSGSNALKATAAAQRNAFDSKHGFPNHATPRPAQAVTQLQPTQGISNRSSTGISRNWKNSEEEEYMWDDMKSRLTDHGESISLRKDGWAPDDAKKLGFDDQLAPSHGERDIWSRVDRGTSTDSISIARTREAAYGQRTSSMWPLQEAQPVVDGLNHVNIASGISGKSEGCSTSLSGLSTSMGPSLARPGRQARTKGSVNADPRIGTLVNLLSGSGGALLQQGQHPLGPASALQRHSQSQNLTEQDHRQTQSQIDKRASPLAGQLSQAPHFQTTHDTSPIVPQSHIQPRTLRNLHSTLSQPSQHLQTSSSLMSSSQGHQIPCSQQSQSELMQSQPSGQTQKPLPQPSKFGTMGYSASCHSNDAITADILGNSSKSSLLAAIMKSGLLSSHSVTSGLPNLTFQDSGALPSHMNIQHSVASEPPPTHLATSSIAIVTPSSVLGPTSQANTSSLISSPQRSTLMPPLPPGPPPASSLPSTSSQMADIGNPLSSLLSSLVVKGLISASSTESQTPSAPQVPSRLEDKIPDLSKSSSMHVSSDPVSSTIPSSSGSELPFSEAASKTTNALSQATMTEKKDLIGVEFKPEIIRELHPPVISALFDDLLHRCCICGLRLRLQEQLDRHLEWHDLKKREQSSCNRVSRMWFKSLDDWVAGNMELSSGPISIVSMEGLVKPEDKSKPVVPADENQSVCVLCGEGFEDFYSHERDEWLYREAVYLTIPAGEGKMGTADESAAQGPIVHSNCISPSSAYELGLA